MSSNFSLSRRRIPPWFISLVGILSLWIFGGVSLAYADDHGNNTSTATSISVNASRSGNIERGGDIDYFRITLTSAGALNIYTTGSTDTYGYLYNSVGGLLAQNDDAGGSYGNNFRIQYTVPAAGTYYIAVKHYSTSRTGAYVLQPGFTPVTTPPPSTDDHGNNTSTATSISVNASRSGNIERGGDIDYFRITLTSAGALNIYTTGSTDTYGYLYNSVGGLLAQNDDAGGSYGNNFRIQYTAPAAGTYYIAVKHYSTSRTGAYVLQPGFTPVTTPPPSTDDHGNNTSTATSISVNASRSGNIERGGDIDYFRITLDRAGALNIYTTSSMDTYGHLYNSAGSQVASNDDSYDGRNFRIQYTVPAAGTYYIAVRHYNSSSTGSYAVRADFVVANPPAAPTLITPSNGATNVALSNVVFRWNAVTGATNYRIVISQNSGFTGFNQSTMTCDNGTCWTNPDSLTATTITRTLNLSGQTYYWRVRANGAGGASGWSATGSFTTAGTNLISPSECSVSRGSLASSIAGQRYNISGRCYTDYGWQPPVPLTSNSLTTSTNYDYRSRFYSSNNRVSWTHGGVDFVGSTSAYSSTTPVYAIGNGIVRGVVRNSSQTANVSVLYIEHTATNGSKFLAIYGHVYSNLSVGSSVVKGQNIGTLRLYGSPVHLHFELNTNLSTRTFGGVKSPGTQDPMQYLINNRGS